MTAIAPMHPALQAYAKRHGLDLSGYAQEGRLKILVDQRYRVLIYPAADGRIAIVSRLLDLSPLGDTTVDALLLHLGALATGMIRDHASSLCIDAEQRQLQLQQVLPADIDVDLLESEMADFLNSLVFWTRTCDQERAQFRA